MNFSPGPAVAVVQARMSSSRLPGKVLLRTCGKPLLQHLIERARRCEAVDAMVVATSTDATDDAVAELCREIGTPCFRGSLQDVLDRVVQAARPHQPAWLVRLTGDCPLIDPQVMGQVIDAAREPGVDYASNALSPTFPDGLDVECMRFSVLEEAWREAHKPSEREHVTPFIHTQPQRYSLRSVVHAPDFSHMRWTVDEPADFVFVSQVFERLYAHKPDFLMKDVVDLERAHRSLAQINRGLDRNAAYFKALAREKGERQA